MGEPGGEGVGRLHPLGGQSRGDVAQQRGRPPPQSGSLEISAMS
jgi:hypothetical protein